MGANASMEKALGLRFSEVHSGRFFHRIASGGGAKCVSTRLNASTGGRARSRTCKPHVVRRSPGGAQKRIGLTYISNRILSDPR